MQKKRTHLLILLFISILLLSGCTQKNTDGITYLTLMSVPSEATIPQGLRLDSILSITNSNPDNPEGPPINVQLGIFGYTNITGEVRYYAYGKKQAIQNDEAQVFEQGFYLVNYSRENQVVTLTTDTNQKPLMNLELGTGITTPYQGELPYYYAETDTPGIYTFVDANGNTMLRSYSTFLDQKNGGFFPANDAGQMIPGALPIDPIMEDCLKTQGSNVASKLLTTPIECQEIQVIYTVS
ncbi:MAG: hypothetical protein ACRCU3_11115 [Eubacteriaceae bacterium]